METVQITINETIARVSISIHEHPIVIPVSINQGIPGLSAYMDAVLNGNFIGTKLQWLASLKGKDFEFEDFTEEQLNFLKVKGDPFTWDDLTEFQKLELKGDPLLWQDLTPEQILQITGEDGAPFTFEDFTPEQLDALKGPMGQGAKYSATDSGELFEKSITDDFLYICIVAGEAGHAAWKKIAWTDS